MAVLRAKVSNAQVVRKIVLEGHRFTPKEALVSGIVDLVAGENTVGVLSAAQALAEKVGSAAKTGAWGINKVRPSPYAFEHHHVRTYVSVPYSCTWTLYAIGSDFSVWDPNSCSMGHLDVNRR